MMPRWKARALTLLGVPCGAWGGYADAEGAIERWCNKPFGHSDSCVYDMGGVTTQPLFRERRRARGWK